jgi:hypothetical protein
MLSRRGDYARALEAADRAVARGYGMAQVERCFVLAELENGPAQARVAVREALDHPRASPGEQRYLPLVLLLLGEREEAIQASLRIRRKPGAIPFWDQDWYAKYLDYNCRRITEDDLLRAAGRARPKLCEAHFLIGLRHLAEGDRASAREDFRKWSETRVLIYWDCILARAFQARMDKDPTWPPWIP